jgi:hypothetical protein
MAARTALAGVKGIGLSLTVIVAVRQSIGSRTGNRQNATGSGTLVTGTIKPLPQRTDIDTHPIDSNPNTGHLIPYENKRISILDLN